MNTKLYLSALFLCSCLTACSWSNTNPYQAPPQTRSTQPQPTPKSPSMSQPQVATGRESIRHNALDSQLLLQVLERQVGRPYLYGGNTPNGFDCSGLVQYSFAQVGIALPRSTLEQMSALQEVGRNKLQTGDLAFFQTGTNQYHVAVMVDAHNFIHAPSSGKTVSTANFSNPYWKKNFIRAARY